MQFGSKFVDNLNKARTLFALFFLFAQAGQLVTARSTFAVYSELQTGIGIISSAEKYFGVAGSGGLGFSGGLHLYGNLFGKPGMAWQWGIANRLTTGNLDGASLAMLTHNLATRIEFYRFYIGGGFSPFGWKSTDGISGLKPNSGVKTFFLEGGLIWKIVPEYQICATVAYEFPYLTFVPTNMEYGLRFRFHFGNPEDSSKKEKDWDGWRYPFGFMR